MFQPFLQHTRAELPDIPQWNPYIMGGRPFQANSQSAVLSPFSVLAYVLPFWGLAWHGWRRCTLFVAALGAFLLEGASSAMRFPGGAAVRASCSASASESVRLGVVDDHERLGPGCRFSCACLSELCLRRAPGRCRLPGWRRSWGLRSSAVTRRRASR